MCKPDSLSNPAIKRPITLKKQEGPDVTMSLETSLKSASQLSLESIQERVFLMLLPEIGTILREKTVRAASVMGSTHSYSTQPDLIISDIREKIGHLPSSTAKVMADVTADTMIEAWAMECRHTIYQYWVDMR